MQDFSRAYMPPPPMSHFITPLAGYVLLFMRGTEPRSPCSLITILIMLPGNNMHFIFCPSFFHHSHHPLPSPPPCPLSNIYLINSFLHTFPVFLPLCLLDLQSCLICVARRVPMKERPILPTHESFTTRQDLQGTPIIIMLLF